jgi:hypothetical protein
MAGLKKMKKAKKMMVYVDEADYLRLKHMAIDWNVSMSDLIRRGVSNLFDTGQKASFLKRRVTARKAVRP